MLDKIYKDEDKFGGTGDNLNFKVTIFYDKCRRVSLPPNAYIHGASIMLLGQAQTYYYANRGNTSTFDQFCINMQSSFEGPEWQRFNLTKWQTISLTDIISANPTLSTTECVRKLCTELETIQRGVDPAYHGTAHLRENIIRACRGHPALTASLTNPPLDTSGLVNNLYTSIVNYEAVHKPMQQSYLNDELNFTSPVSEGQIQTSRSTLSQIRQHISSFFSSLSSTEKMFCMRQGGMLVYKSLTTRAR